MAWVLAYVDDIMFLSRIREAAPGVSVRAARDAAGVRRALEAGAPSLVLADLDSPRLAAAATLRALREEPGFGGAPLVGFVSHVDAERAREAHEAGFTRVLARSAFVRELPGLLQSATQPS